MTDEERTYVVLRIVLVATGVWLCILQYVPGEMTTVCALSAWALVLSAVGTVGVVFSALTGRPRVSRMMMWVLPLDLVSIAIYTRILAPQDAFFGVCVLLVVLYAMAVSRKDAVVASVAISAAYLAGQAFMLQTSAASVGLVAVKTLALALVGVIVASAVGRQRDREREAGSAIADRERMNAQLARRVAELQAVAEVTEIIHSSLDFDEVGEHVLEIMSKVIDFPTLAVFVLDKEKSETLFSASVGVPRDERARAGETLGLGDLEGHLTCTPVFDHGSKMVLFCAPAEGLERLTDDDRLVIYALASELAVAVENSRLYKLTRRLAVTDELTGMSNYRHLQQRLDDELVRARRYGKCLSLLMLDADDFKRFNDSYGHLAGDQALAEFAGVIASVVREVDLVARYGGEEFAVVLPETDAAGAFVAAEKIREALGSHQFRDGNGRSCCTLTVSIGVATYPTYAADKETLLREADDALYRAKNGGKDKVCAPQRLPEPHTTPGA